MKKMLLITSLIIVLAMAGNVYAVSGNGSGNGSGNQNQNQNQEQNQAEETQLQNQNQESEQEEENNNENGSQISEQRRSTVANTVQQLLQVADRNGGIGEQVRLIAQAQNQNQEELEERIEKIENRKGLAKFLIGPNYGQINKANKVLEQNKEQIEELNQLKNQVVSSGDEQVINEQVQLLEQINLQIQNSLEQAEKGFSLLGWMLKLFIK